MIVYGDAGRLESIDRAVEILRLMIDQSIHADPRPAGLRSLLERSGELEQALFDSPDAIGPPSTSRLRALAGIRRATTWIGSAFDRSFDRSPEGAHAALESSRRALRPLRGRRGSVRIALPKGFAFDAIYPESYRQAAIRWAEDHTAAGKRDVLVVGLRTIGTTLSAVVASTLRSRGFSVRRRTVRPSGEPCHRKLEGVRVPAATYGVVVDEGPGLSGSSMESVAEAMRRAGVREVSIVSAHDRGPGARASRSSRSSWEASRRYPASAAPLQFEGRTLAEELWSGVRPAIGGEMSRSLDLSGGAWRRVLYGDPASWPAVCRELERPKLLCTSREGGQVLFKYSGIATAPGMNRTLAAAIARRAAPLAARGFSPRLLGEAHGFVAWEWIDGRPLTLQDATFQFLNRMGAYIARAAGPPMDAEAARGARERLDAMLLANVGECLGDEARKAAAGEMARIAPEPGVACAGDGHHAPHEWIRSKTGTILKVDVGGHETDPTWTGVQPISWDLAAAADEWDLHGEQEAALLRGYIDAGGRAPDSQTLHFYRLAYAAHRVGQTAHFAEAETDQEECRRLARSLDRWRKDLSRCLVESPAARPR